MIQPSKFIYDLQQRVAKKILEHKEHDIKDIVVYSRLMVALQNQREYAELDETQ